MKEVVITADSTCDLPKELIDKYGIVITPLSILLGEESYLDGVDCFPKDIYDYVDKTGVLPKTSAVPPSKYMDVFGSIVAEGKAVVHIGLSSGISSSFQNSLVAAEEYDDVYCIDSKSLCTGMGLLVLKAVDYREKGFDAKKIYNLISALVPMVSTTFVLDNLEYIYKGGRCSGVAKFSANVLGIKPVIAVNTETGKLEVVKKYRGKLESVYKQYINDSIKSAQDADKTRIVIANSGLVDDAIIEYAKEQVGEYGEVVLADAGCTISSHCGPKTLAIFYIKK